MIINRNPYIQFDSSPRNSRWLYWCDDQYYKGDNVDCKTILSFNDGDFIIGPDEVSYWDDTDTDT